MRSWKVLATYSQRQKTNLGLLLQGLRYLCTFSTLTPLITVIPRSEAGAAMVPVSWTEMQCPISTSKEGRKVLACISNACHDNKMATIPVILAMIREVAMGSMPLPCLLLPSP